MGVAKLKTVDLISKPIFANFQVAMLHSKHIDKKCVYRMLVKQVAEYIVANGYLTQELRVMSHDMLEMRLCLHTWRKSELDTPLKDLGLDEKA